MKTNGICGDTTAFEKREDALKLTPKGREIIERSIQHRIDKNTILLKRRVGND